MGIFTKNKNGKSKGKKKDKTKPKGSKATKSKKKSKKRQQSDSSSSSSDSDRKNKGASGNQNEVNMVHQKFNMAGALQQSKPKNPVDFPKKLMQSEYRQMFAANNNLSNEECMLLDDYLKKKAELRSSDLLVVSEKLVDDEKKSSRLKIVTKYDEGRFGGIYVVQREAAVDDNVVANSPFMIMKTALRNLSSPEVCARLNREIRCLTAFASTEPAGRRIPTLLLEGRVLGVPFFVIPLMDVNLEKCREEMNGFFSTPAAFYIAQEILMALKFVHSRGHLHRDVKPTNIVLNAANRNQWFLIDFGECIQANRSVGQSPPDGYGLPFISRETHDGLSGTSKNTFTQDLEAWFYVFFDMLKPLPWRDLIVVSKVAKLKAKFWEDLDASIPSSDFPAQVPAIAKLFKGEKKLEPPYKEISQLLETGFMSTKEADWKPDWLDRDAMAVKNKTLKEKYEKEKKEKELNNKKDEKKDGPAAPRSMYCAAPVSLRASLSKPKQSETKVAKICEDDPKPSPKPRQNLSVYMDITKQSARLPVVDGKKGGGGGKKKYKT